MVVRAQQWPVELKARHLGKLRIPAVEALRRSDSFREYDEWVSSRQGGVLLVSGCAAVLYDAMSLDAVLDDDDKVMFIESAEAIVKARMYLAEPLGHERPIIFMVSVDALVKAHSDHPAGLRTVMTALEHFARYCDRRVAQPLVTVVLLSDVPLPISLQGLISPENSFAVKPPASATRQHLISVLLGDANSAGKLGVKCDVALQQLADTFSGISFEEIFPACTRIANAAVADSQNTVLEQNLLAAYDGLASGEGGPGHAGISWPTLKRCDHAKGLMNRILRPQLGDVTVEHIVEQDPILASARTVLVQGGSGSGKTTFLNALCSLGGGWAAQPVRLWEVIRPNVGQSQQILRDLFADIVAKKRRTVIVVDDVEEWFGLETDEISAFRFDLLREFSSLVDEHVLRPAEAAGAPTHAIEQKPPAIVCVMASRYRPRELPRSLSSRINVFLELDK